MPTYRLLRRHDYNERTAGIPLAVQRKADWAQVLLGTRGRTPTVKSTTGLNAAWRRTPVQGSHYYLWWIPAADSGLAFNGGAGGGAAAPAPPAILVHSIRHHDDTDSPLEVGSPADYEPVEVGLLDPRFEDQNEIGHAADAAGVTLSVIEGMPGSGKSVALIYLARDLTLRPDVRKVRYITYTERLKRAAREIFDGLGPDIAQHITVHTLNDVVRDLLRDKRAAPGSAGGPGSADLLVSNPYAELRTFARDLEAFNPRDVGAWRDFPLTLYTELRAEVVGRTFPPGYQLPRHRDEQLRRRGGHVDVERYARMRGLDLRAAEQAVTLGERLSGRYFTDQVLAAQALDRLTQHAQPGGEIPAWLAHTDAIIVDEVQDLTLVQIALIGEMAHARRSRFPARAFLLTVAGDESQIVQPTGFKWGVTKDLLAERLGVYAQRHEFAQQRRSPPLLARLVDASWGFYAALPKDLRPSARQAVPLAAARTATAPHDAPDTTLDAEPGLAMLLLPPAGPTAAADWRTLLTEAAARPGRALIDLTEQLDATLGAQQSDDFADVLFAAREIKGLERATILIHGLGQTYDRTQTLAHDEEGSNIPHLEARRLIDQMRVALSRATARLVLIEPPDAPVLAALDLNPATDAIALGLPELIEFLQADTMTEVELVGGLLDEAEELADRSRLDDALRRNRRAAAIAERAGSPDAVAQARRQSATLLLRQAEAQLAAGALNAAQEAFHALRQVADALPDDATRTRTAELEDRLTAASDSLFDQLLAQSSDALAALDYATAHATAQRAQAIAARAATPVRTAQARSAAEAAAAAWALALAYTGDATHAAQIADLLEVLGALHTARGAAPAATLTLLLARRYRELPARVQPGAANRAQLLALLALAAGALEAAPTPLAADAAEHLRLWLEECFGALGDDAARYYIWARTAAALAAQAAYPELDEHLWDLENRLPAQGAPTGEIASFAAFLADYNGDPGRASTLWEQLGNLEQAIESARNAGDLERAYALVRKLSPAHVPDTLATAVKTVRNLQQLAQKQHHLYPAERAALRAELARLARALEETGNGEQGTA